MKNEFQKETILVTGGTGSVGSEIVRQLLRRKPKSIRIFARHEDRHFAFMQELAGYEKVIRFIVGDIRDKERLALAMEGVDTVFHAAALKHIPLCEYNPFEAIKTNIIGTQNVIETARNARVRRVIGISTDKVAEPESVLGVSKLMAEKLFLATYFYKGDKETTFACVRFGNVLGSRGSIVPLFKKQIIERGEITITDPEMTRFILTIPQAVTLVLSAAELSKGQEVFILKMPAVRLRDLADAAIRYFAPRAGRTPREINIRIIGKRTGEKQHEKLVADYERERVLETRHMYLLLPDGGIGYQSYTLKYPLAARRKGDAYFSSERAPKLSQKELFTLIAEVDSRAVL